MTPEVIIELLSVFKMMQCMLPSLSSLPPQPPSLMNKYYIARATWPYGTLTFELGFRYRNIESFLTEEKMVSFVGLVCIFERPQQNLFLTYKNLQMTNLRLIIYELPSGHF
jgi:hypothetical protein